MSAQGKSRRLLPLAAALCLMATAAYGGYAAGRGGTAPDSRLAETAKLAGLQQLDASGQSLTVYACVAGGRLTRVSVGDAPACPANSAPVQWDAKSAPAAVQPPPSASPSQAPSQAPSTAPSTAPDRTHAVCVTSAIDDGCGPYTYSDISGSNGNNTFVIQDVWNAVEGAAQTLSATSPGSWSVSANVPAGNTSVVSYPDVQQLYTTDDNAPEPLTGFSSITSSYAEKGPSGPGDDYEAAYDIWTGTGNSNYAQEIMIWVDNHGQTPAGSVVGSAVIDGVGYKIWSTSRAGTVGDIVSMVMDSDQSSGSVNILDNLNWLESNGYMPAGSGLNQIDFGWEICSTGGVPETFNLSGYAIKATCTSGSACTS